MFKVGDASVSALLLLCRHEDPMPGAELVAAVSCVLLVAACTTAATTRTESPPEAGPRFARGGPRESTALWAAAVLELGGRADR